MCVERYELSFLSARCEVWKYNYWCLHRRKWKHRASLCEASQESRARLGSETLVPLSGPWEWHGVQAVSTGRYGDAKMMGVESISSKCFIAKNQWCHLFNALFCGGLGPVFFLQRHRTRSLNTCKIPLLLLQIKFTQTQRRLPCFKNWHM